MKYYLKLVAIWGLITLGVVAFLTVFYGAMTLIMLGWTSILPAAIAGTAAGLTVIGMAVAVYVFLAREELVSRD